MRFSLNFIFFFFIELEFFCGSVFFRIWDFSMNFFIDFWNYFYFILFFIFLFCSCCHGKGRSRGDRQFFFVQNRPCDLSNGVKAINEMYHQYNRHQYPFFVFKITSSTKGNIDVNLTPDKRRILLQKGYFIIFCFILFLFYFIFYFRDILVASTQRQIERDFWQNCSPGDFRFEISTQNFWSKTCWNTL